MDGARCVGETEAWSDDAGKSEVFERRGTFSYDPDFMVDGNVLSGGLGVKI